MTIEEFGNTKFSAHMRAIYKGSYYMIIELDFDENLLGIYSPDDPDRTIHYVRCENVELVKS